jgi:hypothetical protein
MITLPLRRTSRCFKKSDKYIAHTNSPLRIALTAPRSKSPEPRFGAMYCRSAVMLGRGCGVVDMAAFSSVETFD